MLVENNLIDIEQLSSYLKLNKEHVYKNYKKWKIPYVKVGRLLRFNKTSIKEWVDKNQIQNSTSNAVKGENNKWHKKSIKGKKVAITTIASQLQVQGTEGLLTQAINRKRKSL